jgi:Transposase IS116/IS110/IS902 family
LKIRTAATWRPLCGRERARGRRVHGRDRGILLHREPQSTIAACCSSRSVACPVCPGHDESAGKRRSGKTRKGDSWLRVALIEAAQSAAGRTKDTYLRAQYLRIRRRRGHKKAIVAVAHSILVSAYHVLQDGLSYQELGGDYFLSREDRQRITQRLVRQLERLGQTVTLEPTTAEAG